MKLENVIVTNMDAGNPNSAAARLKSSKMNLPRRGGIPLKTKIFYEGKERLEFYCYFHERFLLCKPNFSTKKKRFSLTRKTLNI